MNQCKRVSDCPADRLAQCRGQAVQARCDALQGLLNKADQRIDDLTHPASVPPAMGVRAVVEPVAQCSEVDRQCSEQLRTQGKLLPAHTVLPHPPRHEGFLQPDREVPGYTLEQMKEYGAACAAEALRQNK